LTIGNSNWQSLTYESEVVEPTFEEISLILAGCLTSISHESRGARFTIGIRWPPTEEQLAKLDALMKSLGFQRRVLKITIEQTEELKLS
jgi:hypothetical protein